MVTPVNGTMTARGNSGRIYQVDFYFSDVVGAAVTFNPNGAAVAASQTYWIPPESVVLTSISQAAGNTVALGMVLAENGAVRPGSTIRLANTVNTLARVPTFAIGFAGGSQIGATQF